MTLRGKKARRIKNLEATNAELNRRNRSLTVRLAIVTGGKEDAFTQAVLSNLEGAVGLVEYARTVRGRKEVLTHLGGYCKGIADDLKLGRDLKPLA